jgi:hypothetical protein
MLVVGINGGLGNQMFQYALYLKLKSLGKDVCIDDEILVSKLNNTKALKIFDVFDLHYKQCDKRTLKKLADVSMNPISRIRRKLFGARDYKDTLYKEVLDNAYHPEIFDFDNMYLKGCWQSEKYFDDIRDVIIQNFTFNIPRNEIESVLGQIENSNSVSIHLRRGDYVGNAVYENICNEDYYRKSIDYIREHVENPRFFVFSDDPDYARQQYPGDDFVVVDSFSGDRSHYDMYLMTQCKHNIVANSSFSWWGAWLGQNEDKIVVCPGKWGNSYGLEHTPCENWVKV